MARYFIEVAYKGTRYSGFQVQENANTIQAEIEKAFLTIHGDQLQLTGSSRTDAGVHALQNFFHFDYFTPVHPHTVYKLNALLPNDIAIKDITLMSDDAHSRFDAVSREYEYHIHRRKNPFLRDTSLHYAYTLNLDIMQEAAAFIKTQQNFFPFSKTNTQVKNFHCTISKSQWTFNDEALVYNIEANRFLRGMVRLLTGTLLKLGRGKISFIEFQCMFEDSRKCGFSVPAHGLFLKKVSYPENYFLAPAKAFTDF